MYLSIHLFRQACMCECTNHYKCGEVRGQLEEVAFLIFSMQVLGNQTFPVKPSCHPYIQKPRNVEALRQMLHKKLYLTQAFKSLIFPVMLKSSMDWSPFWTHLKSWLQEKLAIIHSQFFAFNDYKLLHFLERVTNHRTSAFCFISKLPALVVTSLSNTQKHSDGTK